MGLSASQTRFLMLTAQRSDLEYMAQNVQYEKMSIAELTQQAAERYSEATSNTKLVFRDAQNNKIDLTYASLVKDINEGGLGMCIVGTGGKEIITTEEFQRRVKEKGLTSDSAIQAFKRNFIVDDNLSDTKLLTEGLRDGTYFLADKTTEKDENGMPQDVFETKSIGSSTKVQEVYDESDDYKAQADYDAEIRRLEKQDTMLDLELEKIETQHSAVQAEIESISNVIKKNIEKSYNTFSG